MDYRRNSILTSIPPVTANLLIINTLMLLATFVLGKVGGVDLDGLLGLHFWRGSQFQLWQPFTYMFMHAGILHLFFNMFTLWMFGVVLERTLGSKRFLIYYIVCGLGAALVQEIMWEFTWRSELVNALALSNPGTSAFEINQFLNGNTLQAHDFMSQFCNALVTIGASGAVFGVLLAFGYLFPNMPMYIIPFPFPIKAKWMVIGYGVIELLFGITGSMSSVAHYAHLGGMLFGFLLLYWWQKKGILRRGHGHY